MSALPAGGPPAGLVILGFAVLAAGLFFFLEGRRHQDQPQAPTAPAYETAAPLASAPPLQIPPPPPPPLPVKAVAAAPPPPPPPRIQYVDRPPPPPIIQYIERPGQAQPLPHVDQASLGKLSEPALVIDLTDTAPAAGQQGDDAAAHAIVLRSRATLVPQGTLIPAVLETPIDSNRPGPVRAITSGDTRGFDGSRVLIPRGSRLVGEFKSETQAGQKRVSVTWTRLVRPDGVAIRLTSPASDTVGGIGIAGAVNNHIFARVASAVLQSALIIGVNVASNPGNGSIVIGTPGQAVAGAGQSLIPTGDLKPTIDVKEGAAITVFVARDLDFSGALARP